MTDKLLDALRLIEKQADNFTTHWMDDDSEEEHAAAEQAQEEIAKASAAIKAAFAAQRAILAALKMAVRALEDNDIDEAMAGEFEILTDAIAQAEAAGIGEK